MNSKEIKELKQRLTLDSCTITKMKGVYVGSNNEIVARQIGRASCRERV